MIDVKNKVVLITGAGRGIGAGIAEAFVENGAIVYGTAMTDKSVGEMKSKSIYARQVDVNNQNEMTRLIDEIISEHGFLDCIINNAGIPNNQPVSFVESVDYDLVMETNLKAIYQICQHYYKKQRKKGGIIINISSVVGHQPMKSASVYNLSKGALIHLTKSLAYEWGGKWRVNSISPGFIDTQIHLGKLGDNSFQENLIKRIPHKRLGLPEDVAGPCLFLVSDLSRYITGTDILVDGGLTAGLHI